MDKADKLKPKKVSESVTVMTEMVMPNDANPLGNLMGGNLLRWMDIASGIVGGRHCEAIVVTASVDHVSFQLPIKVGEVVTIHARVARAFTTSVEIYVEVFAANMKGGNNRRCNHAYYTMVAIDDINSKPIPVPEIIPLTAEEQSMYESASRRRELRLILSGRIKPKDATEIRNLFIED